MHTAPPIPTVRLQSRTTPSASLPPASANRLMRLTWLLSLSSALFAVWLFWLAIDGRYVLARLPGWLGDTVWLLTAAAAMTMVVLWGVLVFARRQQSRLSYARLALDELRALSPKQFELFVAGLFEARGYRVRLRGRSGDQGVDIELAAPDGRRAIVQCKRYRGSVGPDVVRELFGTMLHELATHAFLVTTGDLTNAARDWAANKPMTLIDGAQLVRLQEQTNE